jgi:hypothetical protein
MTEETKSSEKEVSMRRSSTLPFEPADLVAMRVLPSEFARMVGVSKQAVSQWIKRGTITLGPDGRVEPRTATRQVMERTDPAKMRARVFKQASASHDELRQRVRELEAELAAQRGYAERCLAAGRFQAEDEAGCGVARLCDAILDRWNEAVQARCTNRLRRWLEELTVVEFHRGDLERFRADCPEREEDRDDVYRAPQYTPLEDMLAPPS